MAPDPLDEFDARTRRLRRRRAASYAASCLHEQRPELAAEAGRKGGRARAAQHRDPSAYGRWLARRRWYGALAGAEPKVTAIKRTADGEYPMERQYQHHEGAPHG